ncbi:hypothetical protein [Nocardia cyriacigeorgica]|uniref:hypothetical protein n=1 Tax=Nocardia cyriacigeorgica TaxID=135487 RepID=UPI0034DAEA78
MSDAATKQQLAALRDRAARRSMTVTSAPEGWALSSPFRTVCLGSLANLEAWLSAAEAHDNRPPQLFPTGVRADS